MDGNFLDLDILMTRIREPLSKRYFMEAVRSYKAGALRACLSAAWVAVVYDLLQKYRELSAMGDAAATAFSRAWDQATANNDVRRLLELEGGILEDAAQNTQVLNQIAVRQLQRLREDRHLCAHPAFSAEAALFEPTPELARLHLVSAIDLVLSQRPLQGKAVLEQFNADIRSPGFPSDPARLADYVEQHYIRHIRPANIKNLGIVLAKALLKDTAPEWEPHRRKVITSLEVVRDRAPASWDDISANIIQLMNGTTPALRPRAIAFLGAFPAFWDQIDAPVRTALEETAAHFDPATVTELYILFAAPLPPFRESILDLINELEPAKILEALNIAPLDDLWERALSIYAGSRSFRASEINFRDFILTFAGKMTSVRHDALFEAIMRNGQNINASGTPSLLLTLLENAAARDFPSTAIREQFVLEAQRRRVDDDFQAVITLLQSDGWVAPTAPVREELEPLF